MHNFNLICFLGLLILTGCVTKQPAVNPNQVLIEFPAVNYSDK